MKVYHRNALVIAAGVLWLQVFHSIAADDPSPIRDPVEVAGAVVTIGYTPSGGLTNVSRGSFSLVIRGKDWKLHYTELGYSNCISTGWLFDTESRNSGGVVQAVCHPLRPIFGEARPDFSKKMPSLAYVEKGPVPKASGFLAVSVIWYALCSGDYAAAKHGKEIDPPYLNGPRSMERASQMPLAEVELHEKLPYLPQKIAFLQLPPDGKNGVAALTNATMESASFEAAGNQWLPMRTVFESFFLGNSKAGKDFGPMSRVSRCEITLSSVRKLSESEGQEKLSLELRPDTQVIDRRFSTQHLPSFEVSYESNTWLSDADVSKLPEYQTAYRHAQAAAFAEHPRLNGKHSGIIRIASISFLAASGSLLFVFLFRTHRKSKIINLMLNL